MYEQMLISNMRDKSIKEVEDRIVAVFDILMQKNFPALGFVYERQTGLWMIAGKEEMNVMHENIPVALFRDFDFDNYVHNLNDDDIFWMVDLSEKNVKLMRWYKNRTEF